MGRRKGELSPAGIDRGWPYQIALPESVCTGLSRYETARTFAATLSVCSRGHAFVDKDVWHQVFCFSEKADAQTFKDRFGGEWFDPARRGRGGRWHLLKEPQKPKSAR